MSHEGFVIGIPLSRVVLLCNKEILFGYGTNVDSQGRTVMTAVMSYWTHSPSS